MSTLVKLLLVVVCAAGAYVYFNAEPGAEDNPLIGEWKSHKVKSLRQMQQGGLTAAQEYTLKSILGKMRVTYTEDTWRSELDGDVDSGTYKIVSRKDNCLTVRADDGDSSYICMVDGDMHVRTIFRGNYEVFVRVDP